MVKKYTDLCIYAVLFIILYSVHSHYRELCHNKSTLCRQKRQMPEQSLLEEDGLSSTSCSDDADFSQCIIIAAEYSEYCLDAFS